MRDNIPACRFNIKGPEARMNENKLKKFEIAGAIMMSIAGIILITMCC